MTKSNGTGDLLAISYTFVIIGSFVGGFMLAAIVAETDCLKNGFFQLASKRFVCKLHKEL